MNLGTICVCAIVLLAVGGAVFSLLRGKGTSCGCGCSGCSMRGVCHQTKKKRSASTEKRA